MNEERRYILEQPEIPGRALARMVDWWSVKYKTNVQKMRWTENKKKNQRGNKVTNKKQKVQRKQQELLACVSLVVGIPESIFKETKLSF